MRVMLDAVERLNKLANEVEDRTSAQWIADELDNIADILERAYFAARASNGQEQDASAGAGSEDK